MKLLLAARLSQTHDGQTGIETQDQQVTRWATDHDHEIIGVAADRKSGTVAPWDRPNLKPWVTDPAKISQYDGIVAYTFDRLSRGDKQSTNAIEKWAHDHGKVLLTEDGLVFPSEGNDGIRWDVTARIAHDEWRKASERYRRMQAYLKASGYLVGRPPFAYMIVAMGDHKTLAPDPLLAPYVVGMFARYLAGESFARICEWLDAEAAPTIADAVLIAAGKESSGAIWAPKSVGNILRNTVYAGRRKDQSGKTILRVEPIIDTITFKQVQAKLDSTPRRRGTADPDSTGMLTNILICAKCNGPLYRRRTEWKRVDGTIVTRSFYRCDGTARQRSTCKILLPLDEVEPKVTEWITGNYGDVSDVQIITVPGGNHEAELEDVKQDMASLLGELTDDTITADAFNDRMTALNAERARLKALPVEADHVERRETGMTIAQKWASLATDAERRAWLTEYDVKIVVGKNEAGKWRYTFSARGQYGLGRMEMME